MTWLSFGGGGRCPIEDWIGRRCKNCGTSIIAYLCRLGTKWERRLAFAGPWQMEDGGKVVGEGEGTRV